MIEAEFCSAFFFMNESRTFVVGENEIYSAVKASGYEGKIYCPKLEKKEVPLQMYRFHEEGSAKDLIRHMQIAANSMQSMEVTNTLNFLEKTCRFITDNFLFCQYNGSQHIVGFNDDVYKNGHNREIAYVQDKIANWAALPEQYSMFSSRGIGATSHAQNLAGNLFIMISSLCRDSSITRMRDGKNIFDALGKDMGLAFVTLVKEVAYARAVDCKWLDDRKKSTLLGGMVPEATGNDIGRKHDVTTKYGYVHVEGCAAALPFHGPAVYRVISNCIQSSMDRNLKPMPWSERSRKQVAGQMERHGHGSGADTAQHTGCGMSMSPVDESADEGNFSYGYMSSNPDLPTRERTPDFLLRIFHYIPFIVGEQQSQNSFDVELQKVKTNAMASLNTLGAAIGIITNHDLLHMYVFEKDSDGLIHQYKESFNLTYFKSTVGESVGLFQKNLKQFLNYMAGQVIIQLEKHAHVEEYMNKYDTKGSYGDLPKKTTVNDENSRIVIGEEFSELQYYGAWGPVYNSLYPHFRESVKKTMEQKADAV